MAITQKRNQEKFNLDIGTHIQILSQRIPIVEVKGVAN